MKLKSLIIFGEGLNDLIVLKNHVFDVHGGFLVEGVFQYISVGLLMFDNGLFMGVVLGIMELVGLLDI
jgi:hypothetical protein